MKNIFDPNKDLSYYRMQVGSEVVYFSHKKKVKSEEFIDIDIRDVVVLLNDLASEMNSVIKRVDEVSALSNAAGETIGNIGRRVDEAIALSKTTDKMVGDVNKKIDEVVMLFDSRNSNEDGDGSDSGAVKKDSADSQVDSQADSQ